MKLVSRVWQDLVLRLFASLKATEGGELKSNQKALALQLFTD
jgi:hypothetical protein